MKTKLKVGDKLPEISERLSYRCPFWSEGHTSSAYFDSVVYIILGVEDNCYRFDAEGEYKNNSNFLVKIEDVDKHIMETNTAPKTFAITGSKSLLKAMEEELVGVGYKMGSTQYRETSNFLGINGSAPDTKESFNELYYPKNSFTFPRDVQFQLPQQWDECLAFCKEQLELWDKPKFKVGEWVEVITAETGALGAEGEFGQITSEEPTNGKYNSYPNSQAKIKIGESVWTIGKDFDSVKLRLLTKEEIEKAQKIEVGGHTMEVVNGKFKFGCQYITKEEVETLRKFVGSPLNFKMKVGDTEVNTELLTILLNTINSKQDMN